MLDTNPHRDETLALLRFSASPLLRFSASLLLRCPDCPDCHYGNTLRDEEVPGSSRLTGSVIPLSPEEVVEFFRVDERAAADLNER
jgi:hypothetical protein